MSKVLQPNFTQIPNALFDDFLPFLTDTEFRVLMVIARQTYGWIQNPVTKMRKEQDHISYSQLVLKTGRSTRVLSMALKVLRESKIIETLGYRQGKYYRFKSTESMSGMVIFYRINTSLKSKEVNQAIVAGLPKIRHNLFKKYTLKSKETKETYTKEIIKSNKILEQTRASLTEKLGW